MLTTVLVNRSAVCGISLSHVALLYSCQDPFLHLGVDPADATGAQRDRLWEGALPDILIDGRSG